MGKDDRAGREAHPEVRRPIAVIAVCYAAGTWAGLKIDLSPWHPLAAAAICLAWAALALAIPRFRIKSMPLFAAALFVGWAAAAARVDERGSCALAAVRFPPGIRLTVVGVVADDPSPCGPAVKDAETWQFLLDTELFRAGSNGTWHAAGSPTRMRLHTRRGIRRPAYGERWMFGGRLSGGALRASAIMPGYSMSAWAPGAQRLSGGHGSTFMEWCFARRRAAARHLETGMDPFPECVGVMKALVLGYRQDIPRAADNAFKLTGTTHIFAISGLHVAIIAAMVIFILQAIGVSREHWIWFLAPLLAAYTAATGMSASAVRACVMGIVFFAAPALGRRPDIHASLAFAALLILAFAPEQLFEAGFVLSFVVVFGLVVLYPVFERPLRRFWEPDPLRLQPEPRRVVALRACGKYLASLLAMSCAAWVISAPLTAYYFQRFSPISILSNLIAVPVSFLVLIAGCLSVVLGPVLPFCADVFNHANLVLVTVLVETMMFFSKIPLGNFELPPTPAWMPAAWYAALICWREFSRKSAKDVW